MNDIFDDFFPNGLLSRDVGFIVPPTWRTEISKWLECVRAIDLKYYDRSKTRVTQDTLKQEEVLAEMRSIFFLQQHGCIITALEPNRIDFTFTDTTGELWNAEVKCPSYEQEIFQREISLAKKLARKQLPKYINEAAVNVNPVRSYIDPVRKSVGKFHPSEKNLLIISDNFFISSIVDPFLDESVKNALREADTSTKISAVLVLDVWSPAFEHVVKYNSRIVTISDAPSFNGGANINSDTSAQS